ncbi:DedA family protein [Nocardioides sp. DS6]|uniref:DedA family protein n=1 Tax=Nocardioides eburneus TaxID=3231482 RepID=A0ABV3ST47_9ACTN
MTSVIAHLLTVPAWLAVALVFALPALESAVFAGFVFPGELALLLGGVVAHEGHVPLLVMIAAGVSGAVAGDAVGYAVGRRWGRRILDLSVGRLVKREHLDRARAALAKHGGKTVFLGRFTVALRVLVPGLAGMSGLRYRRFALFNVAGALVWGTLMVVAGYLAGASWQSAQHLVSHLGLAVTGVVVLVAGSTLWVGRRRSAARRARSSSAHGTTVSR